MFSSLTNLPRDSSDVFGDGNECPCMAIFPSTLLDNQHMHVRYGTWRLFTSSIVGEIYLSQSREIGGTFLFRVRHNLTDAHFVQLIQ